MASRPSRWDRLSDIQKNAVHAEEQRILAAALIELREELARTNERLDRIECARGGSPS